MGGACSPLKERCSENAGPIASLVAVPLTACSSSAINFSPLFCLVANHATYPVTSCFSPSSLPAINCMRFSVSSLFLFIHQSHATYLDHGDVYFLLLFCILPLTARCTHCPAPVHCLPRAFPSFLPPPLFFYIHYSNAVYLDHGETYKPAPVHCPTRRRPVVALPTLRPGLPQKIRSEDFLTPSRAPTSSASAKSSSPDSCAVSLSCAFSFRSLSSPSDISLWESSSAVSDIRRPTSMVARKSRIA